MFIIYAIYNQTHDKIYIGQTEDIEKRLLDHQNKTFKKCFTAKFDGEWQLVYQESVDTRSEALRREKQLKSFRGREFLKKFMISNPR